MRAAPRDGQGVQTPTWLLLHRGGTGCVRGGRSASLRGTEAREVEQTGDRKAPGGSLSVPSFMRLTGDLDLHQMSVLFWSPRRVHSASFAVCSADRTSSSGPPTLTVPGPGRATAPSSPKAPSGLGTRPLPTRPGAGAPPARPPVPNSPGAAEAGAREGTRPLPQAQGWGPPSRPRWLRLFSAGHGFSGSNAFNSCDPHDGPEGLRV